MSYLRIFLFASLIIGAKAQGFDLADALDDDVPTKPPRKPDQPKKPSGGDLDLFDALRPDPKDPAPPPKKPPAGGDGFDLSDALNPDPVAPKNPSRPVNPPRNDGKGGGSFGDSDLHDLLGGDSEYKPDPGKGGGGGGGGAHDPYDYDGGRGYDDGQKDLELPWTQILKLLSANMPESFLIWITNLKGVFIPLLEKLMEIIDVAQAQ